MSLIDDYLEWLEHYRGRTEHTVGKYRGYLQHLERSLLDKGKTLPEADLQDLEKYAGLEAHQRGISPRSRSPLVAAVRGFFAWAAQAGHVSESPAAALPYPKAGSPLPRALEIKSAEALLMQPDLGTFVGLRDAAIISLLIGCGLRISGVRNLNEEDLQWVQYQGQEWMVVKTREKGRKERLVPAPHEARLLVRAYLGHEDLAAIDRTLPSGDHVLFVSTRGNHVPAHEYYGEARRISTRAINNMLERHGEKAGIPRGQLHAHAARHLYGTELAEEGADLLQIQALMGHSDPKTSQIYTRLAMRKLTDRVRSSNPLAKMRTPVTDLVRALDSRSRKP